MRIDLAMYALTNAGLIVDSTIVAGQKISRSIGEIGLAAAQIVTKLSEAKSLPQEILDAAEAMRVLSADILAKVTVPASFDDRYGELIANTPDAQIFRSHGILPGDALIVSKGRSVSIGHLSTSDRERWFAFGLRTAIRPVLGVKRYSAAALGSAMLVEGSDEFSLTGSMVIDIDFAARSFTGLISVSGMNMTTRTVREFGVFTIASGWLGDNGDLDGQVQNTKGEFLGWIEGALYGPHSDEIGLNFGFVSGIYLPWDAPFSQRANIVGTGIGEQQ